MAMHARVLERLDIFGEDDFAVEDAIFFRKRFHNATSPSIVYSFIAMKAPDGYWYLTGSRESHRHKSWDELVDFMTDAKDIWVATAWTPLDEYERGTPWASETDDE